MPLKMQYLFPLEDKTDVFSMRSRQKIDSSMYNVSTPSQLLHFINYRYYIQRYMIIYIEKAQNQPDLTENLQVKVPKILALPTSIPHATWRSML